MKIFETDRYDVYHSVREDFGPLMRAALKPFSRPAVAALGPIYEEPASGILAPFVRSAEQAGLDADAVRYLAPEWVLDSAKNLREQAFSRWGLQASEQDWEDAHDWTRAGLVLEVASRLGIPLRNGTKEHVRWKLRGTVTGRFGVEHGSFNPLIIPRDQRSRIVPSGGDRVIVTQDFRAMDLCSILSLFPELADRYEGCEDLHARTADLVGVDREVAKKELFVFAYGGASPFQGAFEEKLPELVPARGSDLARKVQETSAKAFRAGLSAALPLLFGSHVRPLFTVHDELVLDVENGRMDDAQKVADAMADGASKRIGVPYSVDMRVGRNYGEAKA